MEQIEELKNMLGLILALTEGDTPSHVPAEIWNKARDRAYKLISEDEEHEAIRREIKSDQDWLSEEIRYEK